MFGGYGKWKKEAEERNKESHGEEWGLKLADCLKIFPPDDF